MMRVVVVGAGALGGLIGARLTAAGHRTSLLEIDRQRADRLNREGLTIFQDDLEEHVNIEVLTTPRGLEPVDMVYISVKSYQTEAAIRGVLDIIGPDTWVLSMQNGTGNADVMSGVLGNPQHILVGITYHSIQHLGPTTLRFREGVKPIQLGPFRGELTAQVEAIGQMFTDAGLETHVVDNIDHTIWQKLLHNAVVNPVSALTDLTCNELLGDSDLQLLMREVCGEIIAVMQARGVPIFDEEDPYRPVIGSQRALGPNKPSMWQDLSRGVRTEVDAINGAIVDEAERRGLTAPLNWTLVRMIHSRETQLVKEAP